MDILVTLPKSFGLKRWIAEGDAAGEPFSGEEYFWNMGASPPDINPGERVYVCYKGHIIGYAPLVDIERFGSPYGYALVRRGGAVAVTIDRVIPGFRGFRYRDWDYSEERPYPQWKGLDG